MPVRTGLKHPTHCESKSPIHKCISCAWYGLCSGIKGFQRFSKERYLSSNIIQTSKFFEIIHELYRQKKSFRVFRDKPICKKELSCLKQRLFFKKRMQEMKTRKELHFPATKHYHIFYSVFLLTFIIKYKKIL